MNSIDTITLEVADPAAARAVEHGLTVARSFGKKYVEFEAGSGPVKLALYGRVDAS